MAEVTLSLFKCLYAYSSTLISSSHDRLVCLVVKVSASGAEDPGFESRLHWDFFGVESYHLIVT